MHMLGGKHFLSKKIKMEQPIINPTGGPQFTQTTPGNNLPQADQQGPNPISTFQANQQYPSSGPIPKIVIAVAAVLLAVGGFLFFRNSKQTPNNQPTNNTNGTFVLPIGNYKDYAFGDSVEGFNLDNPAAKSKIEEGNTVLPVKVLEKGDGFAEISSGYVDGSIEGVVVNIPLGWEGFDMGGQAEFVPPSHEVEIYLGYFDIEDKSFEILKQEIREEDQNYKGEGALEFSELQSGGFLTRAIDINDEKLGKISILSVYVYNPLDSRSPLLLNLFTHSRKELEKYSGLAGAIVRDLEASGIGDARSFVVSDGYIDQQIIVLSTFYPEAKLEKPEELRAVVKKMIVKARGYGFNAVDSIGGYIESAWLLGENFDTEFPLAAQILNDKKLSGSEKSAWLGDWTKEIFKTLEKK